MGDSGESEMDAKKMRFVRNVAEQKIYIWCKYT